MEPAIVLGAPPEETRREWPKATRTSPRLKSPARPKTAADDGISADLTPVASARLKISPDTASYP